MVKSLSLSLLRTKDRVLLLRIYDSFPCGRMLVAIAVICRFKGVWEPFPKLFSFSAGVYWAPLEQFWKKKGFGDSSCTWVCLNFYQMCLIWACSVFFLWSSTTYSRKPQIQNKNLLAEEEATVSTFVVQASSVHLIGYRKDVCLLCPVTTSKNGMSAVHIWLLLTSWSSPFIISEPTKKV